MFETQSSTIVSLIAITVTVGVVTAFLLYRAAHVRKELVIAKPEEKSAPRGTSDSSGTSVRLRLKKLPLALANDEAAVESITKLVDDETRDRVHEIKQEYSVKYQLAIQEKNKELEFVKRDYESIKQKYQEAHEQYRQVNAQRQQTDAVVKSIAEGLVVVNPKGEVLLMNPSAEKLLGVGKEKKLGKSILEDIPSELMVSLARDSGEPGEKMIELKTKDENVKRVLRASTAVIQNESGQTVGMLNVLTDVTKQKELEGVKNRFISNITHELRTPIVAMSKATALLLNQQAGALTDTQTNFLNIVSRNLGHLNRLVEDLLDVAKIDSGKMRIRLVPSRIDKVIAETCDSLDTWAKSKSVKLLREFEKGLPEFPFDPDKITQVMNNLISNAIKFTPSGGTISVKAVGDKSGTGVLVSVNDTGCGIAKEDMPRLFRRFEQFGDQVGIAGTGLGLSITKDIIERHGGEITVESQQGKGSNFTFTLPLKQRMTGAQS